MPSHYTHGPDYLDQEEKKKKKKPKKKESLIERLKRHKDTTDKAVKSL
tara:strand:- start:184 stop:327 length:144 start_codon:yes stop_codon:yes gene_type:complete